MDRVVVVVVGGSKEEEKKTRVEGVGIVATRWRLVADDASRQSPCNTQHYSGFASYYLDGVLYLQVRLARDRAPPARA